MESCLNFSFSRWYFLRRIEPRPPRLLIFTIISSSIYFILAWDPFQPCSSHLTPATIYPEGLRSSNFPSTTPSLKCGLLVFYPSRMHVVSLSNKPASRESEELLYLIGLQIHPGELRYPTSRPENRKNRFCCVPETSSSLAYFEIFPPGPLNLTEFSSYCTSIQRLLQIQCDVSPTFSNITEGFHNDFNT